MEEYIFGIIIIFVIINLTTLITFRLDKNRATNGENENRVPESLLIKLGVFGGSIGGLIGIFHYRHKSQKNKFKFLFPSFLILHVSIVILLIYYDDISSFFEIF